MHPRKTAHNVANICYISKDKIDFLWCIFWTFKFSRQNEKNSMHLNIYNWYLYLIELSDGDFII